MEELYTCHISVLTALSCHGYLLHSSQVVELGTIDLLLQHELLEVVSCIWLLLQCLKSLQNQQIKSKIKSL